MAAESSVVMKNQKQPFIINYKRQKYQYNINNSDYVQSPQKDFIINTHYHMYVIHTPARRIVLQD